jgi:hypothetical protein
MTYDKGMIVKILVLALLAYVAWRMLKGDVRRKFSARPAPPPPNLAVDTVQCAICGLYLPKGMEKNCGRNDCRYI